MQRCANGRGGQPQIEGGPGAGIAVRGGLLEVAAGHKRTGRPWRPPPAWAASQEGVTGLPVALVIQPIRVVTSDGLPHGIQQAGALRALLAGPQLSLCALCFYGAVEPLRHLSVPMEELDLVVRLLGRPTQHLAPKAPVAHRKARELDALRVPQDLSGDGWDVDAGVAFPHQEHLVGNVLPQGAVEQPGQEDAVRCCHEGVVPGPAGGSVATWAGWLAEAESHWGRTVDDQQAGHGGPAVLVTDQLRVAIVLDGPQAVCVEEKGPELHQEAKQGGCPRATVVPHQNWVVRGVPFGLDEDVVQVRATADCRRTAAWRRRPGISEARVPARWQWPIPARQASDLRVEVEGRPTMLSLACRCAADPGGGQQQREASPCRYRNHERVCT
mmetsp:Transcript_16962/g.47355  ORF Transcript_16962/g.47355 Transcript_16962/m.47355 type:complete len:385 (-) Transcript_16962:129-1283(-)